MRKLATIRQIDNIKPIVNADMIETAIVGGWEVIVKKNDFKIGDHCIFFEIDSFFQENHPLIKGKIDHLLSKGVQKFKGDLLSEKDKIFEFNQENFSVENVTGFRVKTIKMKGQISQGYVMPLSIFNGQINFNENDIVDYSVNGEKDLSQLLGILKYDSAYSYNQRHSQSSPTSAFPFFIPKTDAERIQNIGFKEFMTDGFVDTPLDITIKYDGSSMTVYVTDNMEYVKSLGETQHKNVIKFNKDIHFGICSRNLEVSWKENPNSSGGYDDNHFTKVGSEVVNILKSYIVKADNLGLPKNIALQGELISPNIQNNFENVSFEEYHIFNIYDIDNKQYLSFKDKENVIKLLIDIAKENGVCNIFSVKQAIGQNIHKDNHKSILDYMCFDYDDFYRLKNILKTNDKDNQDYLDAFNQMKSLIIQTQKFFLNEADGKGYRNNYREGIVMKPVTGNGLIFKAISNHYLLKHEK